eukprot:scaffold11126_cov64-Phaeocystis_antarctica.AAC.10
MYSISPCIHRACAVPGSVRRDPRHRSGCCRGPASAAACLARVRAREATWATRAKARVGREHVQWLTSAGPRLERLRKSTRAHIADGIAAQP